MKSLALRAVSALAFVLAPALAFAQALNPVSPQGGERGLLLFPHRGGNGGDVCDQGERRLAAFDML